MACGKDGAVMVAVRDVCRQRKESAKAVCNRALAGEIEKE